MIYVIMKTMLAAFLYNQNLVPGHQTSVVTKETALSTVNWRYFLISSHLLSDLVAAKKDEKAQH